jgi:hypothetical protein
MVEIREPGLLAATIELELERFRRAESLVRMPLATRELAESLRRVAAILRDAEARRQTVDLADGIVRLIQQFRRMVATLGGTPARA